MSETPSGASTPAPTTTWTTPAATPRAWTRRATCWTPRAPLPSTAATKPGRATQPRDTAPDEPPTSDAHRGTLTAGRRVAAEPLPAELAARHHHGGAGEHRRPVGRRDGQPAAGDVDRDRAGVPAGRDERGVGGGARPGAAGAGLADAALVHAQPDVRAVARRRGRDQLDVDAVREQRRRRPPGCPVRSRASRSASVRQARCGLPIETASPSNTRPPTVAFPCAEGPGRPHVDPVAAVGGGADPARAAAGADQHAGLAGGAVEQPLGDEHVQEQPDPVAAHLGDGAVGVAVVHEPLAPARVRRRARPARRARARADDAQHAVAAEAGPAVAEPADQVGGERSPARRAVGVGQDDEVVLRAVALRKRQPVASRARSYGRRPAPVDRVEQVGAGRRRTRSSRGRGGTRSAAGGRTGGWR